MIGRFVGALWRMALMAAVCLLVTAGRAEAEGEKNRDFPKTPPVVDKISVRPGDRWTYQWIDDITGETKFYQTFTLTEIKDGTFSVAISSTPFGQSTSTTGLLVYDSSWGLLDDGVWSRNSGDPGTGVRLPLEVGAEWQTHHVAVRKNPNQEWNVDTRSVVAAYEEVPLRFGLTYDAFRIETTETLTPAAGGAGATLKITLWYAPAVNRYVKRLVETRSKDRLQSRNLEMLTEYKRRRDD